MQLFSIIKYIFTARNEHHIHAPFLYDFYTKVIKAQSWHENFSIIELLRKKLTASDEIIHVSDYGAGSKSGQTQKRTIGSIVKQSTSCAKKSSLHFRIIQYFKPKIIIELGSSLGINTCYMASNEYNTTVNTFEGCPNISAKATQHFKALGIKNITQIIGNFDNTFSTTLKNIFGQYLDANNISSYIFIDGNHRFEPTTRYFQETLKYESENMVLVFDDIHWSEEMEQAWQYIKQHPEVTLTIDLYQLGIVFFRKTLSKQNFILRF